jgi:hypothetical protein
MCDNNESSFAVIEQVPVVASFTSVDSLNLDINNSVQFVSNTQNAISNYWDFGTGQDFSNLSSPTFLYKETGTYNIKLFVSSSTGCMDTAYKTLNVFSKTVGLPNLGVPIKSFLLRSFDNNFFVITMQFEKEVSLKAQLIDASGSLLNSYQLQQSKELELKIDLKDYAKGVYFLTILSERGKQVVKLPVQ